MYKVVSFLILVATLQSCITPLYVPNTTSTPTFIEKGDIELGGYFGSNSLGLQGAYAINKNIGVMLNGSYANNHSDSSNKFREHQFVEVAAGYSKQLNDEGADNEPKFLFSAYGGYGIGTAEGLATTTNIFNGNSFNNISSGNYYRIFAQPSIGWSWEHAEILVALRTNYVHFTNLQNYIGADWYDVIDEEGLTYNIFYEPTITFRTGGQMLKGVFQIGTSIGHYPNLETAFKGRPIIFIMGIHVNLKS